LRPWKGRRDAVLPLHVLDFLLQQSRTPQEIDALHAQGVEYDAFWRFDAAGDRMPEAEFLALWRRHESEIVTEARRGGLPVPDPATYRPHPDGCWVR